MGILNATPDSFSDGGRHLDPDVAVAAGVRMVADGADLIDVGGESTRPGAELVPEDVEIARVVPVIERLAAEAPVPISIDTRKAGVADAAVRAGAIIVNDVSGGAFDPSVLDVVRDRGAGYVVMHMRGTPQTMTTRSDYEDVVADVRSELSGRVEAAVDAGIPRERLAVDPGLGFAKTTPQSLLLMREIRTFLDLGRPVLVGPSRKSFIGHVLDAEVTDRVDGTAGAVAWLASQGVHIVRVHDVKAMARVTRVVDAIASAR
jgi:dihydropteroate synthase